MVNGAEHQAVLPAAAEVCDLNILITLGTTLAPAQQGVSPRAAMAPQQSTETILGFDVICALVLILFAGVKAGPAVLTLQDPVCSPRLWWLLSLA